MTELMTSPQQEDSMVSMPELMPQLMIDGEPLSWTQMLGQMQLFGKLQPFLRETVSQYVLMREVQQRNDLPVESSEVIQEIVAFQARNNITDQEAFKVWLKRQNMNDVMFQQRIVMGLKLKQLRQKIAEPNVQSFFEEHRDSFDQITLSCLVSANEDTMNMLKERMMNGQDDWMQLAKEYGADSDNPVVYRSQMMQRRSLPTAARQPLMDAQIGEMVGPIQMKDGWAMFRMEEMMPAELNDMENTQASQRLRRQIETHLFGQWLSEKIQSLNINFSVAEDANHDE